MNNIMSVAVYGAPAMTKHYKTSIAYLKNKVSAVLFIHCVNTCNMLSELTTDEE